MSTWMTSAAAHPHADDASSSSTERPPEPSARREWGLHLAMPTPPTAPFTLAQSRTPGWDSPWAPRPPEGPERGLYEQLDKLHVEGADDHTHAHAHTHAHDQDTRTLSPWARRKKRARAYLLSNTYVPLVGPLPNPSHPPAHLPTAQLFRFVNITFTTAALAVAIRIRLLERTHAVVGALGSSP